MHTSQWYTCYKKNVFDPQVDCLGPFISALEADKYIPENSKCSTLIPVCKYIPRFLQHFILEWKYHHTFFKLRGICFPTKLDSRNKVSSEI